MSILTVESNQALLHAVLDRRAVIAQDLLSRLRGRDGVQPRWLRAICLALCLSALLACGSLSAQGGGDASGSTPDDGCTYSDYRVAHFAAVVTGADAGQVTAGSDSVGADTGPRRGLRGAFLQLTNDHSADFFRSAVREMAELGMDTVIVQTESYLAQPDFARNAVDRALIRAVLDQAATSRLKVHLGLALPECGNGNVTEAGNKKFVDGVIAKSKESLDLLLQEFADSKAWAGCYLSLELWTPGTVGQLGGLPRYVKEVSEYVKQKRPSCLVSMSPFVSDEASDDGAATKLAFEAIFADSSVDVVALQDGVGERGLSTPQELGANLPYYQAMLDACEGKCEVWANVESYECQRFESVECDKRAANWQRFRAQMQILAPLVPNQISYEYSHYMMPGCPGGARAAALHTAYADWLRKPKGNDMCIARIGAPPGAARIPYMR